MVEVKFTGRYANFTRPENKAERVSYDVMTPSAARGALESILWRPEISWEIRSIIILNPIKRLSILRNEVNTVASDRSAKGWANRGGGFNVEDDRSQRHSLILRDVAYIVRADIRLKPHATEPLSKYESMFTRRVAKGQAFQQPYLGNREFAAFFGPPEGNECPANIIQQLGGEYAARDGKLSLGRMLFDMEFSSVDNAKQGKIRYRQHDATGAKWVVGNARPRFFEAILTDGGVLKIPPELYERR